MIIDTCLLFQERDLLAFRLQELAPVVDRFVIVEAGETFAGDPKPLHFRAWQDAEPFASLRDRISYFSINRLPSATAFTREAIQRAAIGQAIALISESPNDWILVSDLDEIPNPAVIGQIAATGADQCYMFAQRLSYYYVNCLSSSLWHGTRMLPRHRLTNAQQVRHQQGEPVPDAGWHWSYLGGIAAIQAKLAAYSHQEYNTPRITDTEHIAQVLRGHTDLFGRAGETYAVGPIDATYPATLRANLPHYQALGWIAEVPS